MSLPPGYSYQAHTGNDFPGFDIQVNLMPDQASCAAKTQSLGGPFFYFSAGNNRCVSKIPTATGGRDTLVPVSSTSYFAIKNTDFGIFTMPVTATGDANSSPSACVRLCVQTPGCLATTFNYASGCDLKAPTIATEATLGVIVPPLDQLLAICTPTTQCSPTQCGTTITDNCGHPISCPACPSPAAVCVSTGIAAACSPATCGLSIFDNCGTTVQCPSCPVKIISTTAMPAATVGGVVINSAAPATNTGLIAGIAVGALVLIAAIGAFIYSRKSKKDSFIEMDNVEATEVASTFKSHETDESLPEYTGSDLLNSPDRAPRARITHCVTSVPGFYSATMNFTPVKVGQLPLLAGQRVYVTSVTADGWCNALLRDRMDGFIQTCWDRLVKTKVALEEDTVVLGGVGGRHGGVQINMETNQHNVTINLRESNAPPALKAFLKFPFIKPLLLSLALFLVTLWSISSSPNLRSPTSSSTKEHTPLKYISYSLYSADGVSPPEPKFTLGIWNNIKLAQEVYPGWKVLIYVPDTMNKAFVNLMRDAPNVEIKEMPFDVKKAMLWRFLVADIQNVERFIIRDLDSGFQWREKRAVDEWIDKDAEMHIMRDGSCHYHYPIMGGMWGAKGGFTKRYLNKSMSDIMHTYNINATYNEDQNMLRDVIWPVFKDKVVAHDVEPGKKDWDRAVPTLPFPSGNADRFPPNSSDCVGTLYFVGNRMPMGKTYDCSEGPNVQCKQAVYRSFHLNYLLATGQKSVDEEKMRILDSMLDR
ncbi:UNVERIFIED_CONTAM: hypothetical protein HDU68_012543 [Siphonaria sp. JEL0065]|nr:hypothetical protein HDU68_012543 [Siphonaria sp. JEL0065]